MYEVTKSFTGGTLAGLEHTSITAVAFEVGDTVPAGPFTPSPYIVTNVKEV